MAKLKILTISHMFPQACKRNFGVYICREVGDLQPYGLDFHFVVPRPRAPWPIYRFSRWQEYSPENTLIQAEKFHARPVSYFRPPGFWYRKYEGGVMARALLPVVEKWHAAEHYDAVFGVSMLPDGEAAAAIGKALHLPVITLAVGSDMMMYPAQMPVLWEQLKTTLAGVDLPVGVSQAICDRMKETGTCRREPLRIYLGRDVRAFYPTSAEEKLKIREQLGLCADDVVGIYVGNIIETKGIGELARVAPELLNAHENFRLICVGGGTALEKLQQARSRTRREDALILPGPQPPEKVPLYLRASDYFILPSYSEGLPQAVLEAMNCGLAVVATRVGGVPEAVIENETGLLIEPKSDEQLRQAMERMITDSAFRISAGKKGIQRAQEIFDPEKNAKMFAEAILSLMTGNGH